MGWIGKTITVLAALLLIAFFCVDCAGRARLERELEWLRGRGEPLTLEGFEPRTPRRGSDLDVWLVEIRAAEAADDGFSEILLADLEDLRGAASELGPEHALSHYLRALEEAERDASLVWRELGEAVERGATLDELDELQLLALRAAATASGTLAEVGREACAYEGIESRIDETNLFEQSLGERGLAVMRAGVAAVGPAHLAALEGRHDDALRALESGFCAAEILESASGFVSFAAWAHVTRTTLEELRKVLPLLPPYVELGSLDRTLDALAPLENFRYAVRTERVFALAVARGRGGIELPLLARFTRTFDQAELLAYQRAMQETIERGERFDSDSYPFPRYAMLARLMSVSGRMGDPALDLQRSLLLARAVRLARSEGVERARAFCEEAGIPCREDGAWWVAWGPGENGVDDGGAVRLDASGRPLDELWRVRPR